MKPLILIFSMLFTFFSTYAQKDIELRLSELEKGDTIESGDTLKQAIKIQTSVDTLWVSSLQADSTEISLGEHNISIIEKTDGSAKVDSTVIRLGKRSIVIVEKPDGATTIDFPEKSASKTIRKRNRFKGHWDGIEWGFNGFLTPNHSMVMDGDQKFLELKQGRSWNFNVNFLQQSIGFGSNRVGMVTGLGLEFNNYIFRNPTNIKVENGITVVDSSYVLAGYHVEKSKFSTRQLVVPLLFEMQIPIPNTSRRAFLSAGVLGGIRFGSSSKVVGQLNGNSKVKTKGDFNLFSFRYGLTARIGFGNFSIFANYYPTPLFEKGKGPEVYPFSTGLIFSI